MENGGIVLSCGKRMRVCTCLSGGYSNMTIPWKMPVQHFLGDMEPILVAGISQADAHGQVQYPEFCDSFSLTITSSEVINISHTPPMQPNAIDLYQPVHMPESSESRKYAACAG